MPATSSVANSSNNISNNSVSVYSSTNNTDPRGVSSDTGLQSPLEMLTEPIEDEVAIDKWKKHCDEYRAQREYVISLAKEAKEHYDTNVQWPRRKYSFCSDYCQNIDIPHFGREQPGETYYYSPLNVSCFGCCDFMTEKFNAFLYNEGEGKKGGNNVCSLLYKKLVDDDIVEMARLKGPLIIVPGKTKIEWRSLWHIVGKTAMADFDSVI